MKPYALSILLIQTQDIGTQSYVAIVIVRSMGPEGCERKNLKIYTQWNKKVSFVEFEAAFKGGSIANAWTKKNAARQGLDILIVRRRFTSI